MNFTELIWKEPWLAPVALNLTVLESRSIPTAAVTPDGRTFYYHPGWWNRLTPAERLGVQLHELLHIVGRHAGRRAGRDRTGWNLACDMAINAQIADAGYTLPRDALPGEHDCAERIYDRLELVELPAVNGQKSSGPYCGKAADAPLSGDLLRRNADGSETVGSPGTAEAVADAVRLAGRGVFPLSKEYRPLPPAADWRVVLYNLVHSVSGSDVDYLDYEFDEFGVCEDILTPKPRVKLCVLVDESGSIADRLYAQFLGELRALERIADLTVSGFTDNTEFAPVPLRSYRRSMTGGTDVRRCYQQACERRYDCILILTDGQLNFPAHEPCPTIWAMPLRCGRKWEVIL